MAGSTHWWARLGVVALLVAVVGPAGADQALVHVQGDRARVIGQAFLTHHAGRCLAILPHHVVAEAGSPAFVREGATPMLGDAHASADLGDDVGLAWLEGAITRSCGLGIATISREVARRVRESSVALIRSVNADGTLAQVAATVVDDDGSAYLRIRPIDPNEQIQKGQSGSLLVVDEAPVGMLLSVDSRFGVGRVLRMDALLARVEAHLAGARSPEAGAASTAAAPAAPAGAVAARVVAWTAVAADADHRAANLVAGDDAPPWSANVASWPVELDLALAADERIALSGLELDGSGLEPGQLPAQLEVQINLDPDRPRWRSVWGGRLDFEAGRAVVQWAPTWAREVRLRLYAADAAATSVALRRIRFRSR